MCEIHLPNDHILCKLFKDSIWIVPASTLLAYQIVDTMHIEVQDQTIWCIEKYKKGYIFGTAYTLIDDQPLSKTTLTGSITPLGDVLLSFSNASDITSGQGKFIKKDCEWQFLMQMNTLNSISGGVIGLSHWSYMIKITEDDREYYNLPGVGKSVPEAIALFD